MLVRNAVDLVEVNVRHHLGQGIERMLVIDNGSTDGTSRELRRLAARFPVSVRRDDGPFRQAEMVNALVQEAGRGGADWAIPIDADEFFVAPGGVAAALRDVDAAVVEAEVTNFVQRRDRRRRSPRALLTMDHRPEVPVAPLRARPLVAAGRRSVVEAQWDPSVIVRPAPGLWIEKGNHVVTGASGPVVRSDAIHVLHAPVRARAALARRADHGRRLREAGEPAELGWHVRALAGHLEPIDRLWRASSQREGRSTSAACAGRSSATTVSPARSRRACPRGRAPSSTACRRSWPTQRADDRPQPGRPRRARAGGRPGAPTAPVRRRPRAASRGPPARGARPPAAAAPPARPPPRRAARRARAPAAPRRARPGPPPPAPRPSARPRRGRRRATGRIRSAAGAARARRDRHPRPAARPRRRAPPGRRRPAQPPPPPCRRGRGSAPPRRPSRTPARPGPPPPRPGSRRTASKPESAASGRSSASAMSGRRVSAAGPSRSPSARISTRSTRSRPNGHAHPRIRAPDRGTSAGCAPRSKPPGGRPARARGWWASRARRAAGTKPVIDAQARSAGRRATGWTRAAPWAARIMLRPCPTTSPRCSPTSCGSTPSTRRSSPAGPARAKRSRTSRPGRAPPAWRRSASRPRRAARRSSCAPAGAAAAARCCSAATSTP